jgi:hypothetical protein
MDALAAWNLPLDDHRRFAAELATEFQVPVPDISTNPRLTGTLGRYTHGGNIELGPNVLDAGTLVHEFAHHLARVRARGSGAFISPHGHEFNLALRVCALAAFPILGLEQPLWFAPQEPSYKFPRGARVQVNPARPTEQAFMAQVRGYTRYKVRVMREEPGHPHHGWIYAVPETLLVAAPPPEFELEIDLESLGLDLI